MSKNIVICCDGTGNQFGNQNSNIVKLCQMLHRDPTSQVVYYNPGIGTNPEMYEPTVCGKIRNTINNYWDQATGRGVVTNVIGAYLFLMNNYKKDDNVFIFGFSRGAYIARVLCSLIYKFGILDRGNDNLVRYAVTLLVNKSDANDRLAEEFGNTFGIDCKPHFLGVWDTVSSVKWFVDPPYIQHTKKNPDIKTIRHAIAIDERRAYFRANMFEASPNQDCKEVWFPGVHADIGGGYIESESQLAKISLKWMLDEAVKSGIIVDENDAKRIFGGISPFVAPDIKGKIHCERYSVSNLWGVAEYIPKWVWSFREKKRVLKLPNYKWRGIHPKSLVHASAQKRRDEDSNYKPENLMKVKDTVTWVD